MRHGSGQLEIDRTLLLACNPIESRLEGRELGCLEEWMLPDVQMGVSALQDRRILITGISVQDLCVL